MPRPVDPNSARSLILSEYLNGNTSIESICAKVNKLSSKNITKGYCSNIVYVYEVENGIRKPKVRAKKSGVRLSQSILQHHQSKSRSNKRSSESVADFCYKIKAIASFVKDCGSIQQAKVVLDAFDAITLA